MALSIDHDFAESPCGLQLERYDWGGGKQCVK